MTLFEQMSVIDYLPKENVEITLSSKVEHDEIVKSIEKCFDFKSEGGVVSESIFIPKFPSAYDIGLIVGSSGSGKSTILRTVFGEEEEIAWDPNKSIASHFSDVEEASKRFGAVGLNSIPTWVKPYSALSNGEQFRADLARRLHSNAVIDEYTSVVNRETAVSCSVSIEKYIRSNGIKNVTFCSCHDDIIPYLRPDWVYNTDAHEFYSGRYLCRPKFDIKIFGSSYEAWNMFRRHHYLSGDLNKASDCYIAVYNEIPIAFAAILPYPSGTIRHGWREHRIVVLPDYQGMGIGNRLSETLAQAYIEKGCRYFAKTSNPRMGEHRERSTKWRATSSNMKMRLDYLDKESGRGKRRAKMSRESAEAHAHRKCYCHEYIGDGKKYSYSLASDQYDGQINLFDLVG